VTIAFFKTLSSLTLPWSASMGYETYSRRGCVRFAAPQRTLNNRRVRGCRIHPCGVELI